MYPVKANVEYFEETICPEYALIQSRLNLLKVFLGYRQCYSEDTSIRDILKLTNDLDAASLSKLELDARTADAYEAAQKFLLKMQSSSHQSPIEHVTMTFSIQNVSRAMTHQLVRHRLASYSQQSQRYVKFHHIATIVPSSIMNHENPEVYERFVSLMEHVEETYRFFINNDVKAEDSRYITPQAAASSITTTMNLRALMHFFAERCCTRAQWEIRDVARQMLSIAKRYYPVIFANAGPKCVQLGHCPEGETFTCGAFSIRSDREVVDHGNDR
jgi:thymidylate synthase (FAD)